MGTYAVEAKLTGDYDFVLKGVVEYQETASGGLFCVTEGGDKVALPGHNLLFAVISEEKEDSVPD